MEYRDVLGYEGVYRVSDTGVVESRTRITGYEWRQLKPGTNSTGYHVVALHKDRRQTTFKVHRLVLEAFVGRRPSGMVCRHLDGCKTNNCLHNLAWGTQAENRNDALYHGTSKLLPEDVAGIRELYLSGKSQKFIREKYGISKAHVNKIINNKAWSGDHGTANGRVVRS